MSEKLPRITAPEAIKVLELVSFSFSRQSGSHKIYKNREGNAQIFLWVSGHTHTPATNESFASGINLYEKQVTNIHNGDMNRGTIWTNSLYLYPDKVVIKTFNHKKGVWMENTERIIIPQKTIVERSRAKP